MEIQAVKVRRLYLQVAQQLRELIAAGSIRVGERLPAERELAARFGVSRPTIREAMIALEIAGLVEVRSGSGVYVLDPDAAQADLPPLTAGNRPGAVEILEARRLIEGETCALAAQRATAAQLERLRELVDAMALEPPDVTDAEADARFHRLIAEASQNSVLAAAVAGLWRPRNVSPIRSRSRQTRRREGVPPILADHRAILAALEARDAARSRKAMRRHLQRTFDHLMEAT